MGKLKVDLRPALHHLELTTKNAVTTQSIGKYRSAFKGRGVDFDGYRKYTESDDASLIDWKASVRGEDILVKEYIEERNIDVFFLIDSSSSMIYTSGKKLKAEYAAEVIASIASIVVNGGDSLGFAMFTDKIVKHIPFKRGPNQMFMLSKTIIDTKYYGGKFDIVNALKFLIRTVRPRSVVYIFSDFIGLKGEWKKYLEIIASLYDVVCVMVRDPLDRSLPDINDFVSLQDPYSDKQLIVNPRRIKNLYHSHVIAQEKMLRMILLNSNADLVSLSTDVPFTKPIFEYFNSRKLKFR